MSDIIQDTKARMSKSIDNLSRDKYQCWKSKFKFIKWRNC